MKLDAIVYTSNTGNTARYAQMLAGRTGLCAYSAVEAQTALARGARVIYLGWIRASVIVGYREAASRYDIACVLAVGMGETGGQIPELRRRNALPDALPLFTLQGGLFINRQGGKAPHRGAERHARHAVKGRELCAGQASEPAA